MCATLTNLWRHHNWARWGSWCWDCDLCSQTSPHRPNPPPCTPRKSKCSRNGKWVSHELWRICLCHLLPSPSSWDSPHISHTCWSSHTCTRYTLHTPHWILAPLCPLPSLHSLLPPHSPQSYKSIKFKLKTNPNSCQSVTIMLCI